MHAHPLIVCDDDATVELQVKTVKYFKTLEQLATEAGWHRILSSPVEQNPGQSRSDTCQYYCRKIEGLRLAS